jgi:hypothetical protein
VQGSVPAEVQQSPAEPAPFLAKEEPRREQPPVRREQPGYEAVREEQRREAQRREQEAAQEEPKREAPSREEPRREEPKIDSKALLESSGLVMIETDRSKAQFTPPADEPQHLGRPRRDRPKPMPQDDELQQVETRK